MSSELLFALTPETSIPLLWSVLSRVWFSALHCTNAALIKLTTWHTGIVFNPVWSCFLSSGSPADTQYRASSDRSLYASVFLHIPFPPPFHSPSSGWGVTYDTGDCCICGLVPKEKLLALLEVTQIKCPDWISARCKDKRARERLKPSYWTDMSPNLSKHEQRVCHCHSPLMCEFQLPVVGLPSCIYLHVL